MAKPLRSRRAHQLATGDGRLHLEKKPHLFFYSFSAASVDLGPYRADVLIDGKVFDSHEFDSTSCRLAYFP